MPRNRLTLPAAVSLALLLAAAGHSAEPAADEPIFDLHPPITPVEKALAKPVAFQFHELPLEDVIQVIAKSTGVRITLDKAALTKAKVDPLTRVSFAGPRMPLRAVFDQLRWRCHVTYQLAGPNALTITAITRDDSSYVVKTYDVKDLAEKDADGKLIEKPYDWLVDAISGTVAPTTWEDSGGNGTIKVGSDKLIVKQSPEVHEVIADFFSLIRIVRDQPEKLGGGFPRIPYASPQLAKALLAKHDFDFKSTALGEVVKSLADLDVPIVFDDKALARANIGNDTPITLSAKQISAEAFLDLLGDHISGEFETDHDVILLTAGSCGPLACIGFYPAGDIADRLKKTATDKDPYQELSRMVTAIVMPGNWTDSGGPGAVTPLPVVKALVIAQVPAGHKQCRRLLGALRAGRVPISMDHAKQAILDYLDTKQAKDSRWITESKSVIEKLDIEPAGWTGHLVWGPWQVDPIDRTVALHTSLDREIGYQLDGTIEKVGDKFQIANVKITVIRTQP